MQAMFGFWLLLMTLVVFLAKANCQCSEDETQNSEMSHSCNQIYTTLESALVSADNLFVLRITLYPASRFAPSLLEVEYDIQLPDNGSFTTKIGWTDSGVFAAINPRTLLNLQLRILYWPLRNLILEPDTITLTLDARNSEILSNATISDITDVLEILNARLLVYATVQDVLTDWDGTDIGYTWNVKNANDALLSFIVIVTTPIAVAVFLALFTGLRGVLNNSNSLSLFHFLYGLEIPAVILIFVEVVFSFYLWVECQSFSCVIKASTPIAIFIIGICFTGITLWRACARKRKVQGTWLVFLGYFLSNFVFLKAFIALVSISFVPLILLIIVYPGEILCALIIYLSVITLFAVLLAPVSVKSANTLRDYLKEINSSGSDPENDLNPQPKFWISKKWKELMSWILDQWKELSSKFGKYRWIVIILTVFSNVSLAAMLLSLLYMQALLAGATSNVVVNFVLIIVTALIPGGLVYGTGKAIRKRFLADDQVFLTAKTEQLESGQYKIKCKADKNKYLISNGKEGVVDASALLSMKESSPTVINFFCRPNPGDQIWLTRNGPGSFGVGQYKVIDRVGEEECVIENEEGEQGMVNVDDLKLLFDSEDQVYLKTASGRLTEGQYKVRGKVDTGRCVIEVIENGKRRLGIVNVSDLLKIHFHVGEQVYRKPDNVVYTVIKVEKQDKKLKYDIKKIDNEQMHGVVDVGDLLKTDFKLGDRVYLKTKYEGLAPGKYTVENVVLSDNMLKYVIRQTKGLGQVTVEANLLRSALSHI